VGEDVEQRAHKSVVRKEPLDHSISTEPYLPSHRQSPINVPSDELYDSWFNPSFVVQPLASMWERGTSLTRDPRHFLPGKTVFVGVPRVGILVEQRGTLSDGLLERGIPQPDAWRRRALCNGQRGQDF
jgi:hypothetical protein